MVKKIAEAVTTWEKYNWKDSDLWESFQDDFKGYKEEDFRLINNNDIQKLHNFLRRQGFWIKKSRLTIAKSLFNALQEEKPTHEMDTDSQEYLSTEGEFHLYRINYKLKKTPIALFSGIVPPFIPPIIKPTVSISNVSTNNFPHTLSNSHTQGIQGYGKELANLAKMYTDEAKYIGKNNSFTFKLTIFHDNCARADVPYEIKLKAFPTMLTGLALDYDYLNVSISTSVIFDEVCNSIRTYFEGVEYGRSVLSK